MDEGNQNFLIQFSCEENERKILSYLLMEDGTQSAAGLAEIVGSSPRTVQRALKRLMDDGKIEHVGTNRFGHYIVK